LEAWSFFMTRPIPHLPERTFQSYRPTRRSVLLSTAAVIASANPLSVFAQTPDVDFLALSRAVTGHQDLNAMTALRIWAAMMKADSGFAIRAKHLAELATNSSDPGTLLAAAESAGMKDMMLAIVSAWYTGTVSAGSQAAVVVSYADALMYRPVKDGLTVPTYCSNGPLWWTRPTPAAAVAPPAATAKAG
jgi:hypothetical protein